VKAERARGLGHPVGCTVGGLAIHEGQKRGQATFQGRLVGTIGLKSSLSPFLVPSDSYVPLIMAYPGGSRHELDQVLNNVEACPDGQCDGNRRTTDIILEILSEEHSQ
jgi:hypothetical protein